MVSRFPARIALVASSLALAACDPATPRDAGTLDAESAVDASVRDDALAPDAAVGADAASPDAAAIDPPPAIFRTPDVNEVCGPTPSSACTPGDLAWLASEHGSSYRRAEPARVAASPHAYRLVAIVEREGPSNLDVFVVDEAGAPLAELPVAFWYSSAPDASRPDEWYPQRVTTRTGVDGRVGFALGGGAYIPACGAGGPHAVWITEPGAAPDTTIPSDVADGLGMLGGTNHRHLDLMFQRVRPGATATDAVRCPLGL